MGFKRICLHLLLLTNVGILSLPVNWQILANTAHIVRVIKNAVILTFAGLA